MDLSQIILYIILAPTIWYITFQLLILIQTVLKIKFPIALWFARITLILPIAIIVYTFVGLIIVPTVLGILLFILVYTIIKK